MNTHTYGFIHFQNQKNRLNDLDKDRALNFAFKIFVAGLIAYMLFHAYTGHWFSFSYTGDIKAQAQTLETQLKTKPAPLNHLATTDRDKLDILVNTPMAGAIEPILKASKHYNVPVEVFLGIASAESSFKNFKSFNPWGIGNNGPKKFTSWEQAADEFGYTIKYFYLDNGLNTPASMVRKYVGWQNNDWVANFNHYYKP